LDFSNFNSLNSIDAKKAYSQKNQKEMTSSAQCGNISEAMTNILPNDYSNMA